MKKLLAIITLSLFVSSAAQANCDFIFKTVIESKTPSTIFYGRTIISDGTTSLEVFDPIIPLNAEVRKKLQEATANKSSVCLQGTKFLGVGIKLFIYGAEILD